MTLLQDDRFALDKDDQTTFITPAGKLNPKAVQWSEVPQAMVHDQPYLISVLSRSVEVRTDEPRILIQTLEMPRPRFLSWGGQGRVYLASTNLVWILSMVPVSEQVPQLLKDKQFELACTLGKWSDDWSGPSTDQLYFQPISATRLPRTRPREYRTYRP